MNHKKKTLKKKQTAEKFRSKSAYRFENQRLSLYNSKSKVIPRMPIISKDVMENLLKWYFENISLKNYKRIRTSKAFFGIL